MFASTLGGRAGSGSQSLAGRLPADILINIYTVEFLQAYGTGAIPAGSSNERR
jgi:hypothetical protein